MPVYDCGAPACQQCRFAFGPDRTRAIQAAIDSGKICAPFGWVRASEADLLKMEYHAALQIVAE